LSRCVVLDASALQPGRPGPRSPCSDYDEASLVADVYAIPACALHSCWRLCIPDEALDEVKRAFTRVFAAQSGALFNMVVEAGKLLVEPMRPAGNELARAEAVAREARVRGTDVYYLALVLRLARGRAIACRGCNEVVLVTCDAGMVDAFEKLVEYTGLRGAALRCTTPVKLLTDCTLAR